MLACLAWLGACGCASWRGPLRSATSRSSRWWWELRVMSTEHVRRAIGVLALCRSSRGTLLSSCLSLRGIVVVVVVAACDPLSRRGGASHCPASRRCSTCSAAPPSRRSTTPSIAGCWPWSSTRTTGTSAARRRGWVRRAAGCVRAGPSCARGQGRCGAWSRGACPTTAFARGSPRRRRHARGAAWRCATVVRREYACPLRRQPDPRRGAARRVTAQDPTAPGIAGQVAAGHD